MANLGLMTVTGPMKPNEPKGPPVLVSTYGESRCTYREFEDGYYYEFRWPWGVENWIFPRAKLFRVLMGKSMGGFEDDGFNYLGFWFPRGLHDAVFPDGPPPHRDHSGATQEQAQAEAARMFDPWVSIPGRTATDTQDLKIIEIAQMVKDKGLV